MSAKPPLYVLLTHCQWSPVGLIGHKHFVGNIICLLFAKDRKKNDPLAVFWPLCAAYPWWPLMHPANLGAGDGPQSPSVVLERFNSQCYIRVFHTSGITVVSLMLTCCLQLIAGNAAAVLFLFSVAAAQSLIVDDLRNQFRSTKCPCENKLVVSVYCCFLSVWSFNYQVVQHTSTVFTLWKLYLLRFSLPLADFFF